MSTTTIGVDLGVTSASDVAVAEGATVTVSRKVASTPEAWTAAFARLGAGGPVNVVVESTAMACGRVLRRLVDFDTLAVEFEVAATQHVTIKAQVARLEHRITALYAEQYPDDVLLSVPGSVRPSPRCSAAISATSSGSSTLQPSGPTPD